jgi:hypothetical protein
MFIHWVHVCPRNPLVTPRSCIIVQAKWNAITAHSRAHSWPRRWQAPVHWTAVTWHLICGRNWWFANRKIPSRTLTWVRKPYGTRWQKDNDETPTLQLPMVHFLELHPWPALWGHRPLCSIWMVLDLRDHWRSASIPCTSTLQLFWNLHFMLQFVQQQHSFKLLVCHIDWSYQTHLSTLHCSKKTSWLGWASHELSIFQPTFCQFDIWCPIFVADWQWPATNVRTSRLISMFAWCFNPRNLLRNKNLAWWHRSKVPNFLADCVGKVE